mgnify:CR=1 FL=1
MRKILIAAAEGLPFVKSGGLADVVGSLSQELIRQHEQCAVVMPMYKRIIEAHPEIAQTGSFRVQSGLIDKQAGLYETRVGEVTYYFIRQDEYFYRDAMYGYYDDGERFAYFCKAVLEMINVCAFKPDIIHSNDWHTGLIPILAKREYTDAYHNGLRHMYTIHNLAYQGNFSVETMRCTNLSDEYFRNGDIRFDQGISFMKAGIMYADKVTTVSPTYAGEILSSEYGERMEGALWGRKADLCGILNGIDTVTWDPATDPVIFKNYDAAHLRNKAACKKSLQFNMGLRQAADVLLIGVVSRLAYQKGMNLIMDKLGTIMNQDVQLVILGSGDTHMEYEFKKLEYQYPHRAVFYCGYNDELAHRIYAGCDLFMVPSLFEPCGITQQIAMRYGTLPFVRETGGLKDTVVPYNEYTKEGNGFSFRNFNSDEMFYVLSYAIHVYYNSPDDWRLLMKNAMATDVTWARSVQRYIDIYENL